MRCLVTGATGHIGNVLVRKLYARGFEVYAFVLNNDDPYMIEPYAQIIRGDVRDKTSLLIALDEIDVCFHLAGMVEIGTGKKRKMFDINVEGTKNVYQACRSQGVKTMVYTSSVHAIPEGVKGEPIKETTTFDPGLVHGPYAKSKAAAANYLMDETDDNVRLIIVHPSGVIGPGDYQLSNMSQLFIDFLMGRLTAYIEGGYNFVDVRDVAEGIYLAYEKGEHKRPYILSGENITVKELLDFLSKKTGRKKIKTKLARWFILSMSWFAEMYYHLLKQKPLFTHYSIIVLGSNHLFSSNRAKTELGYKTRPIKRSLEDALWFASDRYLQRIGKKYKRKVPD